MKKKIGAQSIIIACILNPATICLVHAHTRDLINPYIRGSVIAPVFRPMDDFEAKFKLGGSIGAGLELNRYLSIEVEGMRFNKQISWIVPEGDPGDIRHMCTSGVLANLSYRKELNTLYGLQAFIGLGIGWSNNKISTSTGKNGADFSLISMSSSTNALAYQAFVGSELRINPNFSVTIDLKWLHLGTADVIDLYEFPPLIKPFNYRVNMQTCSLGIKLRL